MSNEIARSETIDLSALTTQETGFSLADLKQVVYRRWKPALAVGITAFTGIFLLTALKTPEYRSESMILLENPQNQQSTSIAPSQTTASQYYSIKDLSTEIFVLRSNSMVRKALGKLKDRYPKLTVNELIKKLSIHQAIVNKIPTDVLAISYTDTDPARAKTILEALGDTYVEYSLERQRLQAANAIEFIDSQLPDAQQELEKAAKEIRQFRQVHRLVDPETSAVVAGENQHNIDQQIEQTKIAIAQNKKQTQELKRQLEELGQDSDTMVASSVLGQDGVYQNLANQLKDVETQYNLGKVDFHDDYHVISNLKEKRKELKKLLQERAEQVLGKSVSPQILERIVLSPSYTDVQAPVADNATASSDNPGENNSNEDKASGTKVSSEGSTLEIFANRQLELQNQAATLQSQLASLRQTKVDADGQFLNIPGLQQTFTELKRQLELKSKAYNYLLERRQELAISEAEEIAPWRILNEPSLPSKPVSPNIKQGLVQALVASVFLSIATAFMLQKLDQSVKQVDEIKQITKLPLLGVIPKVAEPRIDANIHVTRKSYSYYSSFTEGLRSLAMNLRYLMTDDGQLKTLAVTSSTSAEGKSTISYNLSIVLAELDLRVLIVDADLRKPKLHKLARIPNESGLMQAITKDQPWTNYIQSGSIKNLHLITAGATSPNPIALLNSDKMKQLIQAWEAAYDYVIIDTPPIGVIADAKSLAKEVDSILFVAGIEKASRKAISNSVDVLRHSRCHIAGVVANMVDPEFDYYAHSYHDSYYNQPQRDNSDLDAQDSSSKGKIKGVLQQFRRR
ncbi:polysaccharide biosynthesis tyrosine autokinase [Pleurocapsa sp. PCC 7319]|uniref:GumC family protein n=1 Tax=Pleurocapsa sp. PCC 7319 TaxID=118161 RepID=UPI00034D91DC|nr:polysaccharide biosynthesis tyrosine autokinase [Pleurocapsa sp. PCC 7319]